MTQQLIETDSNLLIAHIKANFPAALAGIRAVRADNSVTTEPPPSESYFIYPGARGFRPPAVFVIGDEIDFRNEQMGANFIDARVRINVSIVVEDKDKQKLTVKAWRYQAALSGMLTQTTLLSADQKVKIVSIVRRATFSPIYTNAKNAESPEALFRKEIILELDVDHYESF